MREFLADDAQIRMLDSFPRRLSLLLASPSLLRFFVFP